MSTGLNLMLKSFGLDPELLMGGVEKVGKAMQDINASLAAIQASQSRLERKLDAVMLAIMTTHEERLMENAKHVGNSGNGNHVGTTGNDVAEPGVGARSASDDGGAGESVPGQVGAGTRNDDIPNFLDRRANSGTTDAAGVG